MKILAMQGRHHRGGIGILALIKAHSIPAILSPVLPILNQDIYRDLPFAKLGGCIENLLLA